MRKGEARIEGDEGGDTEKYNVNSIKGLQKRLYMFKRSQKKRAYNQTRRSPV